MLRSKPNYIPINKHLNFLSCRNEQIELMQQKIVDADQGKLNFTFCSLFLFVYGNSVLTRNSAFHFLKSLV